MEKCFLLENKKERISLNMEGKKAEAKKKKMVADVRNIEH